MIEQVKKLIRIAEEVVRKHDDGCLSKEPRDSMAIEKLRECANQTMWDLDAEEKKAATAK